MAQGTVIDTSVASDGAAGVPGLSDDAIDAAMPELADDEPAHDPAIEARARAMGWQPLDEYRGDPKKWRPAAEFVERGENYIPLLRAENRRLESRVGKLEGQLSTLTASSQEQLQIIKDLREMGRRADQRGYERAMAEIKAKQRQAVEAGNTEAYDQLVEQAEALEESHAAASVSGTASERRPEVPPSKPSPAVSEATKEFIAANPWFNQDQFLNAAMIAQHAEVLRERVVTQAMLSADPQFDADLLEEAKQRVMTAYPERFGTPRREPTPRAPQQSRRRAAAVTPPTGEPPAQRPAGSTIASIQDPAERAEARQAFDRMKRNMPDYTEAEYMALYTDPHADILAAQQPKR